MVQSYNPVYGRLRGVLMFFRQEPCAWLAAVGFAFALLTWYPGRLGITLHVLYSASRSSSYITDFIALGLPVAAAILWVLKPSFRFSDSRAFIVGVGVVGTLCFLAQCFLLPGMQDLPIAITRVFACLYKIVSVILVLLWLEQVSRFPARHDILIIGAGCLTLAVL